ncbi:MAG: hypothetical protein R3D68_14130 [Hyphomicrobiaceae bacterium]
MRTTTMSPHGAVLDHGGESFVSHAWHKVVGFLSGVRKVHADRMLREELSELDTKLLRDIGIAYDEIPRVRARERFTPKNWR